MVATDSAKHGCFPFSLKRCPSLVEAHAALTIEPERRCTLNSAAPGGQHAALDRAAIVLHDTDQIMALEAPRALDPVAGP